jgi:hypothetical protein
MTTTDYQSPSGNNDPQPAANPGPAASQGPAAAGTHETPYQPPAGAYQPPAGAYEPQAGAYQPPAGGYQPPAGPYQPPLPPVTYRARRSTAALIVGAIIVVSGLLTAISGGVLLALFGSGNVLSSGSHVVSTPTTALVADMGKITNTNGFQYITGTPTLNLAVDSFGGAPVFVGVARADDVTRYLSGAAVERIDDFTLSPFQLSTAVRDGARAVGAPAEQSFWVASAQSATGADLDWAIQNGHYQLVIMNADGTANVHTTASVGVSLPNSSGLWILVIGIGVAFIVVGGIVMAIGAGRPAKN